MLPKIRLRVNRVAQQRGSRLQRLSALQGCQDFISPSSVHQTKIHKHTLYLGCSLANSLAVKKGQSAIQTRSFCRYVI